MSDDAIISSNEDPSRSLQERVQNLEQALILLLDFSMMATVWLSVIGSEETAVLKKRWFQRQLDRILTSCKSSPETREHLIRFVSLFEQVHSLPTQSPAREKLWNDLIQKLRIEGEQ
jgi:hypothetical protein